MLKKKDSQRGSALMLVTIISLILTGISAAYITMSWWKGRRAYQEESAVQALYIVEAGAAQYLAKMNAQKLAAPPPQAQTSFGGGSYWIPVENIVSFEDTDVVGTINKDSDFWSFQIAGKFRGVVRRVTVLVSHHQSSSWDFGYAAGNRKKLAKDWVVSDKAFTATFAGNAKLDTYDQINGRVYSGGNVDVQDGARIMNTSGSAAGEVFYSGDNIPGSKQPTFTQRAIDPLEINRDANGQLDAQVMASALKAQGKARDNGVAWIDVAAEFKANQIPAHKWPADNSVAADLPESNPAHFFRQNPTGVNGKTNRTESYERALDTTTVTTARSNPSNPISRNDYYLEDPYNSKVTAPSLTGKEVNGDGSASMINVGPESNNAVYFIDGNMRVSGENVKSYQLRPTGTSDPIKMTFIVKGNVSLTDNLLYPNWESSKDVVAIVAVKDDVNWPNTTVYDFSAGATGLPPGGHPNGPTINEFINDYNGRAKGSGGLMSPLALPVDAARASQEYNKIYGSGNIFFGDPGSGTVENFESYMYAENNFYATNLDATRSNGGTDKVQIYGNMTAGNQVLMDRYSSKQGYNGYIPLRIRHNASISQGNKPPGIPEPASRPNVDWNIRSWKLSSNTAELDDSSEK